MIVVDTSAILAFMNARDNHHASVSAWIDAVDDDLVTTPLILAEVDHLLHARAGKAAAAAFHADLLGGAYLVDWWTSAAASSVRLCDRYADLNLGLADASLVALAERHATSRIATLDERHFRVVTPLAHGDAFQLLPFDA